MKRKRACTLLAAGLVASCGAPADEPPGAAGPSITLAVVGQALIEHDPRQYLDAPLATVAPLLAPADAVLTNLEVAVAGPGCDCRPTRDDVFFHGAGPEVLDYLAELGVSLLSLANNHSWDYGDAGIVSTIEEAAERGFTHAGTGRTLAEATTPAYRDVAGLRVGMVALATVNSPPDAAATDSMPGVNMLSPDDDGAWDRNIAAIREASASADFVIAYQHYQMDAGPGWQEDWARATVDAGADLYISHGEPRLSGIEEYPERAHPLRPRQLHLPQQDRDRKLSARELAERRGDADHRTGRRSRGRLHAGRARRRRAGRFLLPDPGISRGGRGRTWPLDSAALGGAFGRLRNPSGCPGRPGALDRFGRGAPHRTVTERISSEPRKRSPSLVYHSR